MPKISAPTVAEHRERRRAALLEAAATLMLRGGPFTVAEVAHEVGLSRSAVYEYYSSASDLIADVLVDELTAWIDALDDVMNGESDAQRRIDTWIATVLTYVADGRHALVRAAGSVDLPPTRRAEVQERHRALIQPLQAAIAELSVSAPATAASMVWSVVDAAITRIESGSSSVESETPAVLTFVQGGLARLRA